MQRVRGRQIPNWRGNSAHDHANQGVDQGWPVRSDLRAGRVSARQPPSTCTVIPPLPKRSDTTTSHIIRMYLTDPLYSLNRDSDHDESDKPHTPNADLHAWRASRPHERAADLALKRLQLLLLHLPAPAPAPAAGTRRRLLATKPLHTPRPPASALIAQQAARYSQAKARPRYPHTSCRRPAPAPRACAWPRPARACFVRRRARRPRRGARAGFARQRGWIGG
jgi:hypothetical protein